MSFKILMVALASFLVAALVYGEEQEIPQFCLGCICDAASRSNMTIGCIGDVCGPFRITRTYWADGGKLSIDGNSDGDDSAFEECANNAQCAGNTVKGYVKKYSQDCNGDGTIDCEDYARIHHLGGFGCSGKMVEDYEDTFNYCKKIFE